MKLSQLTKLSKLAQLETKKEKQLSVNNQSSRFEKPDEEDNDQDKDNKQDQDDDYLPPDLVGLHFCHLKKQVGDGKRRFLLDYCKQDHEESNNDA